jgi:mannose-6-phosphate isomerase
MHQYQKLIETKASLKSWLFGHCLPIWWEKGADLQYGGFYERLNQDLSPHNIERRTRVAARQVYSYAKASLLGYEGECNQPIEHGLAWLNDRCLNDDGYFSAIVDATGIAIDQTFNLYDHAFILTGLATTFQLRPNDIYLLQQAQGLRDRLVTKFSHPLTGFEEASPRQLPLKANPHMHLLEACLAWIEAGGDAKWAQLAEAIVNLSITKFIDPKSCAILEYFDGDWNPLGDPSFQVIEPGHQFEWAWLLLKWVDFSKDKKALPFAIKLIEIGENFGVDKERNVAINSLNLDLTARDVSARLWPQTERIKAHFELAKHSDALPQSDTSIGNVVRACDGLMPFLNTRISGLYGDRMGPDGRIVLESAPASTLYHLVCAIGEIIKP